MKYLESLETVNKEIEIEDIGLKIKCGKQTI